MAFARKHILIIFFCVIYIALAFSTYKNFGITADEKVAYDLGRNFIQYFSRPSTYKNTIEKYYGQSDYAMRNTPLMSQYYRLYPTFLSLINTKGYYEWYHLLNILFGLTIFVAFYFLLYKIYRDGKLAIVGPIALFLTPRFLGDLPANPKDMPFAVFYFLSLCAIYLLPKPSMGRAIILGLLFGLTQSQRMVGFSIYLIFLIYQIYSRVKISKLIPELFLILTTAFFIMMATWPLVGMNIFQNLPQALFSAQKYEEWNNTMLYFGKFLNKDERPWHYLFTWLFITTPLTTLIFSLSWLGRLKKLFKTPIAFLFFLALIINVVFYLVIQPVVYNGIRHFLYLIPIITVLAVLAFYDLLKNRKSRNIIIILTAVYSAWVLTQMILLHPYQYIYFNEISGGLKGAKDKFEIDYWGASYKEATDFVVNYKKQNSLQNVKVYSCNEAFAVQYFAKGEFVVVDRSASADFILCDIDMDKQRGYTQPVLHEIKRCGATINIVRRTDIIGL